MWFHAKQSIRAKEIHMNGCIHREFILGFLNVWWTLQI